MLHHCRLMLLYFLRFHAFSSLYFVFLIILRPSIVNEKLHKSYMHHYTTYIIRWITLLLYYNTESVLLEAIHQENTHCLFLFYSNMMFWYFNYNTYYNSTLKKVFSNVEDKSSCGKYTRRLSLNLRWICWS